MRNTLCLSRLDNDLVCPFCHETRGGILSLGIHVSEKHDGRQAWFAQMVCDGNIVSLKQSYQSKNKDKRVAASIAGLDGRSVRYYRTGCSNYRMPEEFRFQTVRIRQ